MADHDFAEAAYRWFAAARTGEVPDDSQYARMVQEATECIVSQLSDTKYYSRQGATELTKEIPERDFSRDIMAALAESLGKVKSKQQLSRLAAEYMFFALDSFNAYPDLRVMVEVMNRAHNVMERFGEASSSMTGESRNLETELRFYLTYTSMICDRMNSRIYKEGRERTQEASRFWDERGCGEYAEMAIDAAKAFSKYTSSKTSNQDKKRGVDDKTQAFLDVYYTRPFTQNREGKS